MTAAEAKAAVLAAYPHAEIRNTLQDGGDSAWTVYQVWIDGRPIVGNYRDPDKAWLAAAKRLNIKLNRPT